MRNWNQNLISEICKKCEEYKTPYAFVLDCGWDKNDYDKYAIKLNAGILKEQELQIFKEIYVGVQKILARIEREIIETRGNTYGLTSLLSLWNQSGYGNRARQEEAEERANRYQRVRNIENKSPITLNNSQK